MDGVHASRRRVSFRLFCSPVSSTMRIAVMAGPLPPTANRRCLGGHVGTALYVFLHVRESVLE